jgi:hypothetical protein
MAVFLGGLDKDEEARAGRVPDDRFRLLRERREGSNGTGRSASSLVASDPQFLGGAPVREPCAGQGRGRFGRCGHSDAADSRFLSASQARAGRTCCALCGGQSARRQAASAHPSIWRFNHFKTPDSSYAICMTEPLIDGRLSLELALIARGSEGTMRASHGVGTGHAGWEDWKLKRVILEQDWILATRNREDFRRPRPAAGWQGTTYPCTSPCRSDLHQWPRRNGFGVPATIVRGSPYEVNHDGELSYQVSEAVLDGDELGMDLIDYRMPPAGTVWMPMQRVTHAPKIN